jgi:deoxyribodipyrimidine photolyase-related protein
MKTLRLVLGDQLGRDLPSLAMLDPATDLVVMAEVMDEVTYVKHHQRKIAFLFAAMRHFAAELRAAGIAVTYYQLDDPAGPKSLLDAVKLAAAACRPDRVVVTAPGEYRLLADMQGWQQALAIPVEILPDSRFLCSLDEFAAWASGRKSLRMEFFYRELRRRHDVLMDGDAPVGGKWNYDSENRQPPKSGLVVPPPASFAPDAITRDVLAMVTQRCADHFGTLDGFDFAVTRAQAMAVLDRFIAQRLPLFGDYQDAMLADEPWMYHSHIGLYLNAGLLAPLEVIRAAETAYHNGGAPLNAVEGFIRQILGWREFVRGLYWLRMPDYADANFLEATRPLPAFFWSGKTAMNCLHQTIDQTTRYAYAHHIQRLMVVGNFALLAGLSPAEVNDWFLIVYADAYDWVVLPNVSGMALYADGGYLASKPYAAGGAYINHMSNYCKNCAYQVAKKSGDKACPFNYLYWDFLIRHRDKLSNNARLGMIYRTLDRMAAERVQEITADANRFLTRLGAVDEASNAGDYSG